MDDLIRECHSLIIKGHIQEAHAKISTLKPNEIPHRHKSSIAALCRRLGLVPLGLRILTPPSSMEREFWLSSTPPQQVAEYAILLQRSGAVEEGLKILKTIDPDDCPSALLFLTFCYFSQWESSKALQSIQNYLQYEMDDYSRLTARVNLASALLANEDFEAAINEVEGLLSITKEQKLFRLQANCAEIGARIFLAENNLSEAQKMADQASQALKNDQVIDTFLIKKVKAIIQARKSLQTEPLFALKKVAQQAKDWESCRDLDYQSLLIDFSKERYFFLYFGTPILNYRKQLKTRFKTDTPASFQIGKSSENIFDIDTATFNGRQIFRPGGVSHRTLFKLLSDSYRPTPLAELYSSIYPDEYFNIFTSPSKVHQAVRNLRKSLTEFQVDIQISEDQAQYQATPESSLSIKLSEQLVPPDWYIIHLNKIKSLTDQKDFKSSELQKFLGLGKSPFWRFIKEATTKGDITKTSSGPKTTYHLKAEK